MSKVIDAGISTAYGAAKRGGYTGSYEEFCADLAQLSQVLEEFLGFSVTVETLAAGASASANYDDGVLALGIPRGDTGNGIQSIVLNADYTLTVTYTNGNTWTSGSIRGEAGATPDLQIGTVSTLSPGSPATAEITGTRDEPRLNLGIPQGAPGEVPAASFAPAYDASSTYAVGEYVMHNNALYRCTTAITTAEEWTAAHWTAAKLAEDLTDCSRQLSDKQDAPATAGTAGQVLGLDDQLQPAWMDQTGDGLSQAIKQALLQIAQKVAYTDVHGDEYYQDLYDALYPGIRITNILTGCTTSNSATNITEGSSYSATITASQGYTLTGATVSITMGDVDITSTAYSNGTISIASVTGELVITITAASAGLSYITAVYTQSGTVYDDATLDSLKSDLVVTAHYSDSSTETVPSTDYTLSGTLAEGTSTVTVTYSGKTATFTVVVAHKPVSGMDGWEDGGVYESLEIVPNSYVATATGEINSYNGWDRTGFVPCNGAGTIVFPPMPEGSSGGVAKSNWFYSDKSDTSKISVLHLSFTESTTITVPSNANYFIISSTSSALASCVNGGIVPYE